MHSGDSASVLPPYSLPLRRGRRSIEPDPRAGPRARRRRPDERAVRGEGRQGLRARGQPARVAHRAVRVEGHGRPLAKLAAKVMAGQEARRARRHARARADPRLGQGVGVPVREVSGRRHARSWVGSRSASARTTMLRDACARDALDRRGHGHRRGQRQAEQARVEEGAARVADLQAQAGFELAEQQRLERLRRRELESAEAARAAAAQERAARDALARAEAEARAVERHRDAWRADRDREAELEVEDAAADGWAARRFGPGRRA
jgi:hypothetical protein